MAYRAVRAPPARRASRRVIVPPVKRWEAVSVSGVASVAVLLVLACNEPPPAAKPAPQSEPAPAVGILGQYEQAKRDSMCVEAQSLVGAVEMHLVMDPGKCPADVAALVEAKLIPRVPDTSPSWTITCNEAEVIVSAPGPDARVGTSDDIVAGGSRDTCTK